MTIPTDFQGLRGQASCAVRRKTSPNRRCMMAALAATIACAVVGGCTSGNSGQAKLDITTDVDPALTLKTVLLQVSSGDKTVKRNFSPVPKLQWSVVVPNPKKGQLITASAEGMADSAAGTGTTTVVRYSVQVSIGPGETVPVRLKLTANCSPGPMCKADENCDDGKCVARPTIGIADAGAGGDAKGMGGGAATDGGIDGGGRGGVGGGAGAPDATGGMSGTGGDSGGGMGGATSSLSNGSKCAQGTECGSGICVDGVCCDKPCTGCNACTQTATGKADGTCDVVSSGLDPHNTCADETATNQCGNDGACDGKGVCRKVGTNHQCTAGSCSGATFTSASNCDGVGACKPATTSNCGTFQCSAVDGCAKACTVPTDCGTESYCNASTGTCAAKKSDGAACSTTTECSSGICVDGVCCKTSCTGCNACSTVLTGQASGQCLPIQAGKVAHSACIASGTTCGLDGTCNGNGGCRYGAKGTACGSACSGSTLSPKTCDGVGTCGTNPGSACGGSLICADATTCKMSCAVNGDCTTGNCTGTTCGATKKNTGTSCGTGTECMTGFCVDGTCCGTSSCATCKACNITGSAGTCANKLAGAVDTACASNGANCMTGMCNGGGACQPAAAGVSCGANVCTNGAESVSAGLGQYTAPNYQRRLCDGTTAGTAGCKLGTNQGCTGNLTCTSATACRPSCSRDADCIAGYYCSGVTCVARIISGDSVHGCTASNQCQSRTCVAGFCVSCVSDDDCPASASSCCNSFCTGPGQCDDYYGNADGTLNCTMTGFCGTRHSICGATTATHCSCGGIDCPSGSVCNPATAKCMVNGGQTCVVNSDCLSGTCTSTGICASSAAGAVCDSLVGTTDRPTGCNATLTCIYPIGGVLSVPGINSLCQ